MDHDDHVERIAREDDLLTDRRLIVLVGVVSCLACGAQIAALAALGIAERCMRAHLGLHEPRPPAAERGRVDRRCRDRCVRERTLREDETPDEGV